MNTADAPLAQLAEMLPWVSLVIKPRVARGVREQPASVGLPYHGVSS